MSDPTGEWLFVGRDEWPSFQSGLPEDERESWDDRQERLRLEWKKKHPDDCGCGVCAFLAKRERARAAA